MAGAIEATHRWCVTGTPIGQHGIEDLQGLLQFLRHRTFHDGFWWRHAMRKWLEQPGIPRVVATLAPLFLRRTKDEVKHEIQLPKLEWTHTEVDLTPAEAQLLALMRQRQRVRALRLKEQLGLGGAVACKKRDGQVQAMLHELRLVCFPSHPRLCAGKGYD